MKNYISGEKDFAEKPIWNLDGLHDREDYGLWEPRLVGDVPKNCIIFWRCSACGNTGYEDPTWYCKNCGAMMLNTRDMDVTKDRYMEVLKNAHAKDE